LAGFGSARRGLLLPDYQAVFVQGYAILCFVVLVISIVMVIWRFKKRSFGAYALRVLGTLTLLGLFVGLLLDANRILLIESCGANVVWTEPRDADVDSLGWSLKAKNSREKREPWRSKNIGASNHAEVVQVVFGDGSARSLSKSIDEGVLRKVILGQASDDEHD
jgi:hypothetical protein